MPKSINTPKYNNAAILIFLNCNKEDLKVNQKLHALSTFHEQCEPKRNLHLMFFSQQKI